MRRLLLLILFADLAVHRVAGQTLLHSSFGPGESFDDPGFSVGSGQAWLLSGNNGAIDAMAFTSPKTCPFWRVDVSVRYGEPPGELSNGGTTNFFGPPNLTIQLATDHGGLPGTVLETLQLTNVLGGVLAPGIVSAYSSTHPQLKEGQQYWIVLSTPDLLNTAFEWYDGPNGFASTTYTTQVEMIVTSLSAWGGATFPQGSRPGMAVYGLTSSSPPSPTSLPEIATGGISHAASFQSTTSVAPGMWVSLFGSNLSPDTRGWRSSDFASDGSLPKSLDGVSVLVGGQAAAISFISPGQLNVLIPNWQPYQFLSAIQVITPAGASSPVIVTMSVLQPGLFTALQGTVVYAAATFANGTPVSAANPAGPGDVVVLYGTGFGPSDPELPPGMLVASPEPLSQPDLVTVTIGGVSASVLYAGITEAGLDQFNIIIPQVASGDQPVSISYVGFPTQDGVNLPIKSKP